MIEKHLKQRKLKPGRLETLATSYRHNVHTYHGVTPWSQSGDHLLYLGFNSETTGDIVVRKLDNGRETAIATTNHCNFHNGAGQRWILNDSAVVYSSLDDDRSLLCLAYLDRPGQVEVLDQLPNRHVRQVTADQEHGLATVGSHQAGGRTAIELIDFQAGTGQTIIELAEAMAAMPPELVRQIEADGGHLVFSHPVFNPQQSRLFFKLTQVLPAGRSSQEAAFFVMDLNPREIRCFGRKISGHPCWLPDGQAIVNIVSPQGWQFIPGQGYKSGDGSNNRWLVAFDAISGDYERLIDLPIEGPGHPDVSPNGQWLVTDAFTSDGLRAPIYGLEIATGQVGEIARLDHLFAGGQASSITRGQPHPVWSPDGRKILVNCNQGGQAMRLIMIHDFLIEP